MLPIIYQSPRRRERARFAGFLAAAEEASASPIDAGASSDAHRFAPFRPGMSWSTGGAPPAQICVGRDRRLSTAESSDALLRCVARSKVAQSRPRDTTRHICARSTSLTRGQLTHDTGQLLGITELPVDSGGGYSPPTAPRATRREPTEHRSFGSVRAGRGRGGSLGTRAVDSGLGWAGAVCSSTPAELVLDAGGACGAPRACVFGGRECRFRREASAGS